MTGGWVAGHGPAKSGLRSYKRIRGADFDYAGCCWAKM